MNMSLKPVNFPLSVWQEKKNSKSNNFHVEYLCDCLLKEKLLPIIRSPAKSIFGIHDPLGVFCLSQLRVGFSKLNIHIFKHSFKDTLISLCPADDGIEDTEHFLFRILNSIISWTT